MKSVCLIPLLMLFLCQPLAKASSLSFPGEIGGLLAIEQPHPDDWIQLFVCRGEQVEAGQRLDVQRNRLGKVMQEYIAGSSGRVTVSGRVGLGAIDTTVEVGTVSIVGNCRDADCSAVDRD